MQGKYMLLALIVSCHHVAQAHILTSTHVDVPLATCMKFLEFAVINELCPLYADSSEEYDMPVPHPIGSITWPHKEKIMQTCCTRPCTLTELKTIC